MTHYNCPSDNSNNGHYVPANHYWEQDFTAQGATITSGNLGLGANQDGGDHRARVGIYTGSNRSGPLGEIVQQVDGYGGFSFTFSQPINVAPGQHLWIAATGVGDFTAYDQRPGGVDGCFIGAVNGFNPPPPDGAAPTVSAFSFSPSSVEVSGASQNVSVTVHLADSPAGVRDPGSVVFTGPGTASVAASLVRVTGDDNDGDYQATVAVPQDAQPGTWTAMLHGIVDNAGNALADGPPPGSPSNLTVTSTHPDVQPPSVTAFDFNPRDVNAGATIQMTISVSDDVGTDGPERLGFTDPGGRLVSVAASADPSHPGTFLADVPIPADAASGTWTATILNFHDRAGNHGPEGAPPTGFPRDLHVTATPPPQPTFHYAIANVSSPVSLRAGPGVSTARVGALDGNSPIDIICQTVGESVNGSPIWDYLVGGNYVSDWYTTTPVVGDYSPGIPHCAGAPDQAHPPAPAGRWQIVASTPVNVRNGPSLSANVVGSLAPGARYDIACQTYGSYYLGSPVWDRLPDGRYIHDYFTNTPVFANFSPGLPICAGTGTRPSPPSGSGGGSTGGGISGGGITTGGGGGAVRADYVALGDSFSSGEGSPDSGLIGFTQGQACHRSSLAYPVRFARLVGAQLGAYFRACSGALADDLLTNNSDDRWQLKRFPSGGARLVTVTIGGNDIGFEPIVQACVEEGVSCTYLYSNIPQKIANFGPILRGVYRQIKNKTLGGRVVVLGYPRFFPSPGRLCVAAPGISGAEQDWINDRIMQFDGVARAAAAQEGVDFINPDGAAFVGHDVCSPSAYINGAVATFQEYSFHPNAAGHLAMAQALVAHGVR